MRLLSRVIFGIIGLALAGYCAVVLFLIRGVSNVVDGAKADPTQPWQIVLGLAQFFILCPLAFSALVSIVIWLVKPTDSSGYPRPESSGNRQVERNWEKLMSQPVED